MGKEQKPVAVGDELNVHVEAIAQRGDGIAKIQGFVVFIKGGQLDQNVRVRVTKVFDKFAVAEPIGG